MEAKAECALVVGWYYRAYRGGVVCIEEKHGPYFFARSVGDHRRWASLLTAEGRHLSKRCKMPQALILGSGSPRYEKTAAWRYSPMQLRGGVPDMGAVWTPNGISS